MKLLFDAIYGKIADFNGTTEAGTNATTIVDLTLNTYADDYFNGGTVEMTSGICTGETRAVTDFVQATGTLTTAAFSGAPGVGQTFILMVPLAVHIGTRLYPSEAKQEDVYPYATYELLPSGIDWTMCLDMQFEDISLQFNLFSDHKDPGEVTSMFTDLKTLYDWCDLGVIGYTNLYMRRELYHLLRDVDKGIWQYVVQYGILLEF